MNIAQKELEAGPQRKYSKDLERISYTSSTLIEITTFKHVDITIV